MWIERMLQAARRGDRGLFRYARPAWRGLMAARLPVVRPVFGLLYAERTARQIWWPLLAKFLYREPMLRYRCARVGRRLQIGGPMPHILGNGTIEIGDDVFIGGKNSWQVGFRFSTDARLKIGNGVFIGYQNLLSVANYVEIGDGTMFAHAVSVFDNISHPLSPARRARHEPITMEETAPVIIGRNVWIGAGARILKGACIGDNSVVAAGSIVTRSVPPNTVVAGNPARVIRDITDPAAEPES
jgi:acetyltransferase-like isoleucine patch superfamily enzyme